LSARPPRATAREYPDIGGRLRAARRGHRLSIRELAKRLDVSPSLISQIETGRAQPSVSTLYSLAAELNISLDELLFIDGRRGAMNGPANLGGPSSAPASVPGGPVQRAADRKKICLASGVVWERLTTHSEIGAEFLYVVYQVGGASSPEHAFQRHSGHEWGFVLSGQLHVAIGFDDYELAPGDAVSIDSSTPHRLYNVGSEPVHALWFVLGPQSVDAAPPSRRDPHEA
jgi:quercetin dioxygenase-like cupin family protein/DNA-binding XRE family transcriptional regulator